MLGRLWSERSISGIGIDLSVAAIEFAARRLPSLTWVVANADRRLPLQDNSVDLVLSIHGRRNPTECARVLKATGALIVVLPAPDDLLELRTLVQGQGVERDRIDAMLREHQEAFTVLRRVDVRETIEVERQTLLNLLQGTYRGARVSSAARVRALERTPVTFSSHLVALRRS
jgi:23S rRNA (guanine745-N1)-methyltransferase